MSKEEEENSKPEELQSPPSQFDSKEDLDEAADSVLSAAKTADQQKEEEMRSKGRGNVDQSKFSRGVILFSDEAYSMFKVVEEFDYGGEHYSRMIPGFQLLVRLINDDIQNQQAANVVLQKLINEVIPIDTPSGTVNMRILDLIGQITSDITVQKLLKQQVMNNPSGIIMPGRG